MLRRASFRIAAYFGKHFDESGPPKGVVSTSPRLAIRTGGIFRSTVPGQTGNVNEFSFESANAVWNYGSKVFYWMFHEYADSFNVHFKQRETFNPAIADFAAKEGPVIGDEVGLVLQKIWEGR